MSASTAQLFSVYGALIAGLAAFVSLQRIDPPPASAPLQRWLRRLLASATLLVGLLAIDGLRPPPAAAWLPLALGCLAAVAMLDARQRSDLFHALGALPLVLGVLLAQALAMPQGSFALDASLVPALCLLAAAATAFMVVGHFRRRRSGSPTRLRLAAAMLLALGLLGQRLLAEGAPADGSGVPGPAAWLAMSAAGALLAALGWHLWRASRRDAGDPLLRRRDTRSDPVSGLPQVEQVADAFIRVLRLAVAGHGGCAVVVLHFPALERILSTQGQDARDRLYANAAWRLRSARRDEELLAAMGEQRFLLVLRVADAADAARRVRELVGMFDQPVGEGESRVRLRPGAGISLWPEHGNEFSQLLANALVALERCPPGGLQLFHAAQREENEQHLQVEHNLARALGEGEISLVLQPIIDALSGEVRMVELLARWNHPALGNISPRQFILVAESSGSIAEFDRWLLREALSTTKWLDAAGFPQIRVALNCSPVNLIDPAFLDDFERGVLDSGVNPARLEVEVTEAALAEGERAVVDSLVRLRSLGIGLTIDDFGIGHSSLARLRDLPVDTLKIDQSFVRDMDHPKGEFLVSGILGLAHGLGKAVIAEGVEHEAQRRALTDLGCEYLQGFLIARPLSWRALLDFLGAEAGEPRNGAPAALREAEDEPR